MHYKALQKDQFTPSQQDKLLVGKNETGKLTEVFIQISEAIQSQNLAHQARKEELQENPNK